MAPVARYSSELNRSLGSATATLSESKKMTCNRKRPLSTAGPAWKLAICQECLPGDYKIHGLCCACYN